MPSAEQLHRWSGLVLLAMGDGILPFDRGVRSSTLSKETPVLLSRYGIAGLLDGILEVLGGHRTLVVGDLDRALLDVGVGLPHSGELVQLALDRGPAVAAAHVRNPQSLLSHCLSFLLDDAS